MKNSKQLAALLLLVIAIFISFSVPIEKQKKPDILSSLHIPCNIEGWKGVDISDTYMNLEDQRYNFIDGLFAAEYQNSAQQVLCFSITESGHFHNPLICFKGAGFEVREFPGSVVMVCGEKIKFNLCQASKNGEGFISAYWLCVDKKVLSWWGQLKNQFWTSLLKKTNVSFMVRFDLPFKEGGQEKAIAQVRKFIEDMGRAVPEGDRDFIFGQ